MAAAKGSSGPRDTNQGFGFGNTACVKDDVVEQCLNVKGARSFSQTDHRFFLSRGVKRNLIYGVWNGIMTQSAGVCERTTSDRGGQWWRQQESGGPQEINKGVDSNGGVSMRCLC